MDTSGYQVTDLEDIEFVFEDPDLNIDAVFRPGIDTPFSLSNFNVFEMFSLAENPIVIGKGLGKENSSNNSSLRRPTQHPVKKRSRTFETRVENTPDYVFINLFEYFKLSLLCKYSNMNCNQGLSIYYNLFQKTVTHVWDESSSSLVFNIFPTSSSKVLHKWSPYREGGGMPWGSQKSKSCVNEYKENCLDGGES